MKKRILPLSLLLCFLNLTTGCTEKPWLERNVTFYCEELNIVVMEHYGYINYQNRIIETDVWWSPGVSDMGIFEKRFDSHRVEYDLLNGDIKYDGKMITFFVEQDKLFDHQYEKIYFKKRLRTEEDKIYFDKRVKELQEYDRQRSSYSSQDNSSAIE